MPKALTNQTDVRTHWGKWVLQRAAMLGFRTQRSLAAAVGSSHNQVNRWVKCETPPETMNKGYDRRLAETLKVDPAILFSQWPNFDPRSTPIISDQSRRQKIIEATKLLSGDRLKALNAAVEALLSVA